MKDTGGPAFPTYESNRDGHIYGTSSGIDIRDYFAAKAMQGFAADPNTTDSVEVVAKAAYKWADAMLEARKA